MNELPQLPAPHMRESIATAQNTRSVRHGYEQGGYARWPDMYTADQMRAFRAAGVREAIERAAKIADEHAKRNYTFGSENADVYHAQAHWAERIAAAIRATLPRTTAPQE